MKLLLKFLPFFIYLYPPPACKAIYFVGQTSVLPVLYYSSPTFLAIPFIYLLHSHHIYLHHAIPCFAVLSLGYIAPLKQVILLILNLSKCTADSIHRHFQH